MRVGGYGWGCGVSYAEDAQAFGDHIRHGGDWRYALLVARWVQPRTGGRRATAQNCAVKVSAREFAETASVGDRTVMAYLKAWNEGARRGLVPNSETIDAGEDISVDGLDVEQWSDCYRAVNTTKGKREPMSGSSANGIPRVGGIEYWKTLYYEAHADAEDLRREVEHLRTGGGGDWAANLFAAVGEARQESVFKALTKVLHPDVGGDDALMQALNDARVAA